MRPLLAYMWMASKTSCIPKPESSGGDSTTYVGRDPEFEAIIDEKSSDAEIATGSQVADVTRPESNQTGLAVHSPRTGAPSVTRPLGVTVTTTRGLSGTGFRVNGRSTRWRVTTHSYSGDGEFGDVCIYSHDEPAVFNLSPCDVRRWQLAREAMDKYQLKKPSTNLDLVTIKPVPESMVLNILEEKPITWAHLGFSLVAASYGGLHALAWNAKFPTHRELKLWRISALVIASPAALYLLLTLLVHAVISARVIIRIRYPKLAPDLKDKLTKKSQPKPPVATGNSWSHRMVPFLKITLWVLQRLGVVASGLGANAIVILYFFARGYLVYESFRTVFFLPPEAYMTASWPQYLPHIT